MDLYGFLGSKYVQTNLSENVCVEGNTCPQMQVLEVHVYNLFWGANVTVG